MNVELDSFADRRRHSVVGYAKICSSVPPADLRKPQHPAAFEFQNCDNRANKH
jgi:hypothetical protein